MLTWDWDAIHIVKSTNKIEYDNDILQLDNTRNVLGCLFQTTIEQDNKYKTGNEN